MTKLTLPPLAYGTMQWGAGADRAASETMFNACLDQGITHFDTAYLYTDGASETLLGDFTHTNRDRVQIATKVGYTGGAGHANILAQFDISRSRLKTDYVDVLYLHRFDPDTPLQESISTLADLQSRGLIRHIGVSNFAAWQVMKAQGVAQALGTRIAMIQPMYSLIKRQAEVEILPMAADQDIAVAAYSPLGAGLLTGKYTQAQDGRLTTDPRYKARYDMAWMHDTAAALARLAETWGHHPATLAVAWAKHTRVCPLISAKSMDQLAPSLRAADLTLTPDQYTTITALSQAPTPATDRLEEA